MTDPDVDRLTEQLSPNEELHRDQAVRDLEKVLRLPEGRRMLVRILDRCGLYRIAYSGEKASTNLRLGEQNIGLWLMAQIETVGPTEYPRLLLEAAQRKDLEPNAPVVLDADTE